MYVCDFDNDDPNYLQVHPKLNQMDQDKVARIYSELRKESIVRTGTKNILLLFFFHWVKWVGYYDKNRSSYANLTRLL